MRFTAFLVAVLGTTLATADAQAQLFRGRRNVQQMPVVQYDPFAGIPGSYQSYIPGQSMQSGSYIQPGSYVQPYAGNMIMPGAYSQPMMPFGTSVTTTAGTNQTIQPVTYMQAYPGGPLVPVNPAIFTTPATGTTSSGVVTAGGTRTDSGTVVQTSGTSSEKASGTTTTGTTTAGTTTGTTTGPIILPGSGMVYGQPYAVNGQVIGQPFYYPGMTMPYGTNFGYQPTYMSGYTPFNGSEFVPVNSQPVRRGLFGRMRR
jgi:hypothetical protein